ncbi:chromate efflux transporter [Miltoncostaea oceani]|uniref:chromate efflux transporter n=1 Tax=Miltoncostaea oceani TaxID=2843216 RepID=UPI001C3E7D0F
MATTGPGFTDAPATPGATASPSPPGELEALRFWLKLGCVSFGGPAGQIAIMHAELVERRAWISERRFLHALNFCMALPGPEAQQLASYIGHSLHGLRGALAAGGLFVLPSFVLLVAMSAVYAAFGEVAAVAGVVRGLGAAVVALILAAIIRIGGRVIRTPAAVGLAVAAFLAFVGGMPFVALLAVAAVIGWLAGRWSPAILGQAVPHGEPGGPAAVSVEPATPPVRARWRLALTLAAWLVPVAVLLAIGGLAADLAGLFTVAALVTFGGAYAVLPFVADQAVERFGWLSPEEMVAGLALGESTPGPLIMVNTFVGYMAGYNVGGGHWWGLAGATIATFCTFAPSFVIIMNGAPLIDRVHGAGALTHALTGITIAVVGVIGGLAVFVGENVLIVDGRPDWLVVGLAAAAFLAVWRFRVGVLPVVGVCAVVGLLSGVLG